MAIILHLVPTHLLYLLDLDPALEMAITLHLVPDHLQAVPSRQHLDPLDLGHLLQVIPDHLMVPLHHLLDNQQVETTVRQIPNLPPIPGPPQAVLSRLPDKVLETMVQLDLFPQVGNQVDHSHPVASLLAVTNHLDNNQAVPPLASQPIPDQYRLFLRAAATSQ